MAIPYCGATWDLLVTNAIMGNERITDETDDVEVTYVLTHKGDSYLTGSMEWEAHGYEDTWVARFLLPSTPGVLKAEITSSATVDEDDVMGKFQTSIKVV